MLINLLIHYHLSSSFNNFYSCSSEIENNTEASGNEQNGTSSNNDHPEYKNIPEDDGYQSIASESEHQLQPGDSSNKHKSKGKAKRGMGKEKPSGHQENHSLLEDSKDENNEKYYTLWTESK